MIPNRENLRDALIAAAIGGAVALASKVYAATPTPAPSGFVDGDSEFFLSPEMQMVNHTLSTPLGHALVIALVLVTGLAWGLAEHKHPARKLFAVAFGGAVALGLNTLLLALFGG